MGSTFDTTWSSGPLGPGPLFVLLSQTDAGSERNYVLGAIGGSGVYRTFAGIVQYCAASDALTPVLRRTLNDRIGSRGPHA